nr:MAG TPA: hypothetical protein [Caudoviricetes sp.]
MKEKTYFEVLGEIERSRDKYKHFDVQLLLGSICAKLVEQVKQDEKVESINYTIPIRDQLYNITVSRLEKSEGVSDGIREI